MEQMMLGLEGEFWQAWLGQGAEPCDLNTISENH